MADTMDDRRDSARLPFRFAVREKWLGGSFEEHDGNLSIGGVYYTGLHPPVGAVVEIRFFLPDRGEEIRATGEVIRVSRDDEKFGNHIKFTEIPLESELALARFFQERSGGAP